LKLKILKTCFFIILAFTITFLIFKPSYSINGELIINENKIFIIESRSLIQTGNITIKDNGTLLIKNGDLQLSIRGEKAYNITVKDKGKILIFNGNLTALNEFSKITIMDNGNLTLLNAFITGFGAINFYGNASFTAESLKLNVKTILGNCSIVKIINSEAANSKISLNCSKAFIENFNSETLNLNSTELFISNFQGVNFKSSTLKTNVKNVFVDNALIKSLNASIKDSSFKSLTVKGFGKIYNVTTMESPLTRAGGIIYALSNSSFQRYWYLTLTITDLTNTGIPANVTIYSLNNSIALKGQASINGIFKTAVLAEEINETKTIFVGNYFIQAEYKNYSTFKVPLTIDSNKNYSIKFYYIIPIESAVSIQILKEKVKVGEFIEVKGKINPPIEKALIEIHYIKPDQSESIKAVFTNIDGSFTSKFNPDTPGKWIVYAVWIGGENYAGNKALFTQKLIFYVEEKPSPIKAILTIAPIAITILALILAFAFIMLQKRKPK